MFRFGRFVFSFLWLSLFVSVCRFVSLFVRLILFDSLSRSFSVPLFVWSFASLCLFVLCVAVVASVLEFPLLFLLLFVSWLVVGSGLASVSVSLLVFG